MKTGKYMASALLAFLICVSNYCETKAATQVVVIRPHYQNKEVKASDSQTLNDLNETIKDMKYQLMCAQNEIIRLQEINQNLTKSLSEAEVNSQMIKKQNLSLIQTMSDKTKQLDEMSKQSNLKLNVNNNEVLELKNQLFVQQKRNEEMSKLILGLNNELNTAKVQSQYLNSLEKQLANKEKQIQELSNKISILNNLATSKPKEFNPAETEINELKTQVMTYRKKAEDLYLQVADLNKELNKTKLQYESVNKTTNIISNDKYAEISFLKSKLSIVEKQIQDSSYKINALNNDLLKTKEVYSSAINRQKELENLLVFANKRADDLVIEKDAQINKIKKELAEKTVAASPTQTNLVNNTCQKPATEDNFINIDNKKSAEDYFNIAKAYQTAKDYKESINNYKNAIAVDDSFGNAYKELGLVYAQIGDYKNASSSLKKYLCYSTNIKEQEIIRNFLKNIENSLNK